MATPSEDGDSDDEDSDAEDDYFTGNENSNPRTTATQAMDLLALHIPPEKLIPPLLQYIEPVSYWSEMVSLVYDDPVVNENLYFRRYKIPIQIKRKRRIYA